MGRPREGGWKETLHVCDMLAVEQIYGAIFQVTIAPLACNKYVTVGPFTIPCSHLPQQDWRYCVWTSRLS